MIKFRNGHELDFCVSSGALGYDGQGYFWEYPWRWFGLLRPDEFTIITKTLTYKPKQGNLRMWCPWRCVRLIKNGVVNSVGLTNPGFQWWINKIYPTLQYKTIVSISPDNISQAIEMINGLNALKIVGIQLNISCPNVDHDESIDYITKMTREMYLFSRHPLILKLSYNQPIREICRRTEKYIEAFELINSVPWYTVYPHEISPLAKYNLIGGVSGAVIKKYAETALERVRNCNVPIISGGGIDSYEDIEKRYELGANAFAFGTIFLRKPWLANCIANKWRADHK